MNKQESKKLAQKVLQKVGSHLRKTVVVGLSGGPDSVFLYHVLQQLKPRKNFHVIAAHINHQLRPAASQDEKFVKKLVANFDDTFASQSSDIKALSKKNKAGLEETGRKIRYDFFKKLAAKHKASLILTAHHADDNLETIVMNLTRGASLKGLTGIRESDQIDKNITLLRPLLDISKSQIIAYLKFNKIPYRTDQSNFDTDFTRNFIRHKVIPQLKKINPNLSNSLSKNTTNLRLIDDFITTTAQKWIEKSALNQQKNRFPLKTFQRLHPALQQEILCQLFLIHNTSPRQLEKIHIEEVLTMLNNNIGNKQKKLGKVVVSLKSGIINLQKC